MLISGKVLVWLIQRVCELLLGAALALAILGPNARGGEGGTLEDLRQNLYFVLFFFVTSGYLVTTALICFSRRVGGPVLRSWMNVGLFLIHIVGFLALTAQLYSKRMMMVVVFGVTVVAFSSLIGESVRSGLERSRSSG